MNEDNDANVDDLKDSNGASEINMNFSGRPSEHPNDSDLIKYRQPKGSEKQGMP